MVSVSQITLCDSGVLYPVICGAVIVFVVPFLFVTVVPPKSKPDVDSYVVPAETENGKGADEAVEVQEQGLF